MNTSTTEAHHVGGLYYTDYNLLDFIEQLKTGNKSDLPELSFFSNSTNDLDIPWLNLLPRVRHKQRTVWDYLLEVHGPRRGPLATVIAITCVYGFIFLSGIFGNVCTCLVIVKNKYMHTATNYYLFNLAIADLLLLIVGLPPETYSIWSAYPWIFGEAFCIVRTMLAEMSTNASILTITAFTIERYVAICYPMKAQTMSGLKRVIRVIVAIWFLAAISSVPLTVQFKVVYAVDTRNSNIPESAYCGIGETNHIERTFEISTFLFFVFPMTLVSVMYTLIALAIRKSGLYRDGSDASHRDRLTGVEIRAQQQARARRSVLKMLVAVVVAFFVCWAPFHAQRLMTLYIPAAKWTEKLLEAHKVIYYVSGVCYFISCTINPLLYSIMSLKFRQAFKQTVLRPKCCKKHIHTAKKRTYFSNRFTHKNGYSETSFTSVEPVSPARSCHSHSHSHSNSDHSADHARLNTKTTGVNKVQRRVSAHVDEKVALNCDAKQEKDIANNDIKMVCKMLTTYKPKEMDNTQNQGEYVGLYNKIEAVKEEHF
ncbi:pyrokinin-1 receptor-like [Ruditapes philippinarum]|uniref:pyrokinin-1 receptor-like n=1 Tax=Ruditapes philippinarum TaxID=129788 RepID=UPI00295B2EB8|nr:pyrokinin-1 receptor-like [Ruditapes philippinarum]